MGCAKAPTWWWHLAFGYGAAWTLQDTIWSELPIFLAELPGGFKLPARMVLVSQLANVVVPLVFVYRKRYHGAPSFEQYVAICWGILLAELAGCVVMAIAWRWLVGCQPVVMFGVLFLGNSAGTLASIYVYPFIATFSEEELVSAVFAGGNLGSLVCGVLGLLQMPRRGERTFSASAFYAAMAVTLVLPIFAWRQKLRKHGLGLLSDAAGGGAGAAQLLVPRECEPSVGKRRTASGVPMQLVAVDEAAQVQWAALLPAEVSREDLERVTLLGMSYRIPKWFRETVWLWALVLPMNLLCWGLAPSTLAFAAAGTSAVCDPADEHTQLVLRWSLSLGFAALPFGALMTTVCPTYHLGVLAAISSVVLWCYLVYLASALGWFPEFFRGSAGTYSIVIAAMAIRSCDTYVTAMVYRVLARRYAEDQESKEASSSITGLVITVATTLGSVVAAYVVESDTLSCDPHPGNTQNSSFVPSPSTCT